MHGAKKQAVIDPLYQKYTKSVIRALGSSDFYAFFMDSISKADNEFQFSNRKLEKTIDLTWVDAIEESLEGFQNIIAMPRNVIKEEELIVNVANAKKAGADVVRHLAQHASLVEDFNDQSGEVRPSHLMQKYREDSVSLYENRLVYTALESAYHFVKVRHDALLEAMSDEFGAKLKLRSDMDSATEHVHLDMFLHIKNIESAMDTDEKNAETFARISRMYRLLGTFMNSQFGRDLAKVNRVKGTITKTNVLKKNPNYKKIVKLWEFLRQYDQVGYTIRVVEQSPEINEVFERDIYHNILFNYLVLKGYLEDPADRQVPVAPKTKKRTLKPKFIHQIVEELTEDYDLPDVEIRKVLIEELTKEQLMQEEAAERRRLVEEQAQRKKAEQDRIKAEKKAEQDRIKAEKAAERERIRQEKAAEEAKRKQEEMAREMEDRRRSNLLRKELAYFTEKLPERLNQRIEAEAKANAQLSAQSDYEDAAKLLEESEERKREAAERLAQKQREADEQYRREQRRLKKEERELRRAQREAAEEQARLEAEQAEAEAEIRRRVQQAADEEFIAPYAEEMRCFRDSLALHRQEREQLRTQQETEREMRQQTLRERRQHRNHA